MSKEPKRRKNAAEIAFELAANRQAAREKAGKAITSERAADREPDQRVDLGGQAAARSTHATGPVVFFWALAACWCTRMLMEPIIWKSPS